MRLLFDENISYRIKKKLKEHFPGSKHISDISKSRITDLEIWKYAKVNDLIIVSKDEDFYEWQLVRRDPPKISWIRIGNANTNIIRRN